MQDEQYLIDKELGQATLECLPPTWNAAELVIDLTGSGTKVSLSPMGVNDVSMPSDDVFVAVGKLVQLHRDHHTGLQKAVYTFRRRPNGKWGFTGDFTYPP